MDSKELLLKALRRGETVTGSLSDIKRFRSLKISTRVGELEREEGLTIKRGWTKAGKKLVRSYKAVRRAA